MELRSTVIFYNTLVVRGCSDNLRIFKPSSCCENIINSGCDRGGRHLSNDSYHATSRREPAPRSVMHPPGNPTQDNKFRAPPTWLSPAQWANRLQLSHYADTGLLRPISAWSSTVSPETSRKDHKLLCSTIGPLLLLLSATPLPVTTGEGAVLNSAPAPLSRLLGGQ